MWWRRREASSFNFTSCAWCGRAGGAAGPAASTAAEPSILIGWCDVWERLWWCRACPAPPRRRAGVPWCRCRKRRHLMEGEQVESCLTETSAEELHPIWKKLLPDLRWKHETDSHVQAQGLLKKVAHRSVQASVSHIKYIKSWDKQSPLWRLMLSREPLSGILMVLALSRTLCFQMCPTKIQSYTSVDVVWTVFYIYS